MQIDSEHQYYKFISWMYYKHKYDLAVYVWSYDTYPSNFEKSKKQKYKEYSLIKLGKDKPEEQAYRDT